MHTPRKRFGQNFLHDKHIIQRIVDVIAPKPGQQIVEIGPGQGALTIPVLERAGKLNVIELDRDLIPLLEENCQGHGELTIHAMDALAFDFSQLAQQGQLRVIGNLPYNISTPLIFHLLEHANHIIDMHFMLQKEVVDRMAAHAGDDAYGRLSIMVQYHCEVTALFNVPPGAFNPPPKVNSSIVRLVPHKQLPCIANNYAHFSEVVKLAFNQRRKTLRNCLKTIISDEQWQALGIDPSLRPEQLTLADYVKISNFRD